jgi:hypothetical protein
LTEGLGAIRRANAEALAEGLTLAGADDARIVDDAPDTRTYGRRLRDALAHLRADGLVVLGSGSIPLARPADLAEFVATAAGPAGRALANNRFSADVVAIAGLEPLAGLPDLTADNGLPRWLTEDAGFIVDDLRRRWRLQVDLDSPFDAFLVAPRRGVAIDSVGIPSAAVRAALAGAVAVARDPHRELVVAGRASADGLAWLERSTPSRTRALIEERGFRTRRAGQRPVRSTLGLLLDRDGPGALGTILAELGDAALVDSRVLLAHQFGADEHGWPGPEDRFASDLLRPDGIADPWLRTITTAAVDAPIPIVLGGHSLVGPGLRLVLERDRSWS